MQLPRLVLFFSFGTHCAALILNSLVSPQLLEKKQSTYTRWQSPLIAAALLDGDNTTRLPGHSHIRSPAKAFYRTMGGSSQQADQSNLVYCNMVLECKSIEGQEPAQDVKMCGECVPKLVKLRMPCYLSCAKWVDKGNGGSSVFEKSSSSSYIEKSSSLLQKENTRESTASGRHALMHKAQSTPGQIGCNQVFGVFQDDVYGRFEMEMAMMTFIEGEDLKLALYQISCRSFGSISHFQELAIWGQMKSAIVLMPPQTAMKFPNQCQDMITFIYSAKVMSSFIVNDQIRCGAEYRLTEEQPEFEDMMAPIPALVCNFCNKPFVDIDKNKRDNKESGVDEDKDYRTDAVAGECAGRSCQCEDACEEFFMRCFTHRHENLYSCDAYEECREEFDNTGGSTYVAGDDETAVPFNRRRTVWASSKEDSFCEPLCYVDPLGSMAYLRGLDDYNTSQTLPSTCDPDMYPRRRRTRRRVRRREAVTYQDRRRSRRRRQDATQGDMSRQGAGFSGETSSCDECCGEKNAEIILSKMASSGRPAKMRFEGAGNCAFFVHMCIKEKEEKSVLRDGRTYEHLYPYVFDECRAPIDNPCSANALQEETCRFYNPVTEFEGLGAFTRDLCDRYVASLYKQNQEGNLQFQQSNDIQFCSKMFKPNGSPKSHGYQWLGQAIQKTCEPQCRNGDKMIHDQDMLVNKINLCRSSGRCGNATTDGQTAYNQEVHQDGASSLAEMKNEDYYYY